MSRSLKSMSAANSRLRRAGLGLSLVLGFSGSAIMGVSIATASGAAPALTAGSVAHDGSSYGSSYGTTTTTSTTPSTTTSSSTTSSTTSTTPSTTTTTVPAPPTTVGPKTAGNSLPPTTPVTASSHSLAFTGAGTNITWLFLVGLALLMMGVAMFVLVDAPRRLLVLHGYHKQPRSRRAVATTIWYQETAHPNTDLWHGTGPSGLWHESAAPEPNEQRRT
jgi:hypothetical protein